MRWLLVLLAACEYQPPAEIPVDTAPVAEPTQFTLFVADFGASEVHRFAIADSPTPPTANLTIQLAGALSPFARPASDDLLIGEVGAAVIVRFTTPLAQPTSSGQIQSSGLRANMGKMTLVDDQLFVVNQADTNVLRYAIDGNNSATEVGEIPDVINGRGIFFDEARRNLYVTQCCGINAMLHYGVDALGKVQLKSTTSGVALSSPHGVLVTPWGELLVANAGSNAIRRFTLSSGGMPVPSSEILGNGINVPIDLVMTPWQELYVTNQGTGTISRFTFDENHTAIPRDNFAVPGATSVVWATLDVR